MRKQQSRELSKVDNITSTNSISNGYNDAMKSIFKDDSKNYYGDKTKVSQTSNQFQLLLQQKSNQIKKKDIEIKDKQLLSIDNQYKSIQNHQVQSPSTEKKQQIYDNHDQIQKYHGFNSNVKNPFDEIDQQQQSIYKADVKNPFESQIIPLQTDQNQIQIPSNNLKIKGINNLPLNNQSITELKLISQVKLPQTQKRINNVRMEQISVQVNQNEQIIRNVPKFETVIRSYYSNYFQNLFKTQEKPRGSSTILNYRPYCFKAIRFGFKKKTTQINNSINNSINIAVYKQSNFQRIQICKLVTHQNCIYFYQIPAVNIIPFHLIKPTKKVPLPFYQYISPFIQYDKTNTRLLFYSNTKHQVVIYGFKTNEIICRLAVQNPRYNPILYLTTFQQQTILMVIGGFEVISDQLVQGAKSIQLFSLVKWSIVLKQRIIKIPVGRIYPLVFEIGKRINDQGILIMGGNSTATYKNKKLTSLRKINLKDFEENKIDPNSLWLNYCIESDINQSTNKTAIFLNNNALLQILNNEDQIVIPSNLNVKIEYPKYLYAGLTLYVKVNEHDNLSLLLPFLPTLQKVRIIQKEVHILPTNLIVSKFSKQYYSMQMEMYGTKNDQIVRVGKNGQIQQIKVSQKDKIHQNWNLCGCNKNNCLLI